MAKRPSQKKFDKSIRRSSRQLDKFIAWTKNSKRLSQENESTLRAHAAHVLLQAAATIIAQLDALEDKTVPASQCESGCDCDHDTNDDAIKLQVEKAFQTMTDAAGTMASSFTNAVKSQQVVFEFEQALKTLTDALETMNKAIPNVAIPGMPTELIERITQVKTFMDGVRLRLTKYQHLEQGEPR